MEPEVDTFFFLVPPFENYIQLLILLNLIFLWRYSHLADLLVDFSMVWFCRHFKTKQFRCQLGENIFLERLGFRLPRPQKINNFVDPLKPGSLANYDCDSKLMLLGKYRARIHWGGYRIEEKSVRLKLKLNDEHNGLNTFLKESPFSREIQSYISQVL